MQLFKILLGLFLVLSIYSCKTKTITVRYEGRVVERYQVLRKNNLRDGFYRVYHENGNLALEHNYVNDKLDGMEVIYHEDGSLAGELSLSNGKYDGPFVYYHPNGALKQKGYYNNDKLTGLLCSYHDNGKVRECVMMRNNMEDGPFRQYSRSGVLIRQGTYISLVDEEEGLEEGWLYEYDEETMKLKVKKICEQGFCCPYWERGKGYLEPTTSVCDEIMGNLKEKKAANRSE